MSVFYIHNRSSKGPKLRSFVFKFPDELSCTQCALTINTRIWRDKIKNIISKKALFLINKRKSDVQMLFDKYMIPCFECAGKTFVTHGILFLILTNNTK